MDKFIYETCPPLTTACFVAFLMKNPNFKKVIHFKLNVRETSVLKTFVKDI